MGLFNDVGDQTIHRQSGPSGPGQQGQQSLKDLPVSIKHLMETMMQMRKNWQISRSVLMKKMQQTRSMLMINSLLS